MLDGVDRNDIGRPIMLLAVISGSPVPSPSYDSHVSNDVELLKINSSSNICIDRTETFERLSVDVDVDDASESDSRSSRPRDSVSVDMNGTAV